MSVCLGLRMVLRKSIHPLLELVFCIAVFLWIVTHFHAGLTTQGYDNGNGWSSARSVSTMASSLHGKNIFYFNAPLLLFAFLCCAYKEQGKIDIESVHHSNIGLKTITRGSFLVRFFISTHHFGVSTLGGVPLWCFSVVWLSSVPILCGYAFWLHYVATLSCVTLWCRYVVSLHGAASLSHFVLVVSLVSLPCGALWRHFF